MTKEKAVDLFNISSFSNDALEKEKEFQLLSPDTQLPINIYMQIVSSSAPEPKKIAEKNFNKMRVAESLSQRKGKVAEISFDESIQRNIDLAMAVVKGWRGIATNDGELPYSEENKRMLLTNYAWIREQVLAKAEEESFFYEREEKK